MEQIKLFFNKHGFFTICVLVFFFLLQTCNKTHKISTLTKQKIALTKQNDSLRGELKNADLRILQGQLDITDAISKKISIFDRTDQMKRFQLEFVYPIQDSLKLAIKTKSNK
jgi:hypothetical protein